MNTNQRDTRSGYVEIFIEEGKIGGFLLNVGFQVTI